MPAGTVSYLSSSDNWRRPSNERTKEIWTSESWRERRGSKERGETSETEQANESGKKQTVSGSWRNRRQETAKPADLSGVYGEELPAEAKLKKLYKSQKVDTNMFIEWLVESVYPSAESLPSYITLSRDQIKDYPKYEIIVNYHTAIARQIQRVSPITLALLDRVIEERTEYSHWMSIKHTDEASQVIHEQHLHYIKVMKDVRVVLAERKERNAHTSSPTRNPSAHKRKHSSPTPQSLDARKAIRIETTTLDPDHKRTNEAWRQLVVRGCETPSKERKTLVIKPTSYAAAALLTTVA